MSLLFIIFSIIQSLAISLGVGCSTIAIVYYLTTDFSQPPSETRTQMVRVVYILLRVALILMLISTGVSAYVLVTNIGILYFTTYAIAIWTYLIVLIGNAFLMMFNLIPRSVGPGFQASTWYALGITVALPSAIITNATYSQFLVWYFGFVGAIVLLIALYLAHQKGQW